MNEQSITFLMTLVASVVGPIILGLLMGFFGLFTMQSRFEKFKEDYAEDKKDINLRFDRLETSINGLKDSLIVAFAVQTRPQDKTTPS